MALLEQIEQSSRLFRSRECSQNCVENIPGIASTRLHSRHRCSVLTKNANVTTGHRCNHNKRMRCNYKLNVRKYANKVFENPRLPAGMQMKVDLIDHNNAVWPTTSDFNCAEKNGQEIRPFESALA